MIIFFFLKLNFSSILVLIQYSIRIRYGDPDP